MTSADKIRRLYIGDNLAVMRGLDEESVDLIYLDPPFNSKRMYEGNLDPEMGEQSFKDIWTMSDINKDDLWRLRTLSPTAHGLIETLAVSHGEAWRAYLTFMAVRLDEMHKLLKPTGSIFLHCDYRMSAPLKLLLDVIFGEDNFRNEIVWHFSAGSSPKDRLRSKHQTIFFYVKEKGAVFNQPYIPYAEKDAYRFNLTDEDGRKYRINHTRGKDGEYKRFYLDRGTPLDTVWTYLRDKKYNQIGSTSKERTGWATQKPLAILEQIVKACSNKGGLVLDPFCGCATACIAAEQWERQWIGIDQHPAAEKIMKKRAKKETNLLDIWDEVEIIDARKADNLPRRGTEREIDKNDQNVKRAFYDSQGEKCKSGKWCISSGENGGKVDIHLMDYDRIDPGKRGGYYTPENVQLLCGACNRAKGAKTWTQFIKERKAQVARGITDDPDVPR